jgi:branched-chain amino acid transport system ATP-binding protein
MLIVNNLSSHYGDLQALREVSLTIDRHQIVSIIGSNGAGKTTLINAISGILPCSAGTITFEGKEVANQPPHTIVEQGIVQVPEGRLLFPHMSVLENLELGAYNSEARKILGNSLEMVFGFFPKLKDRRLQLAGTLSGGEQQMVAIGRGLMARPKLLMLDEPSLGLSPLVVKEVFEAVEKIKAEGITILLVEQNIMHSLLIADKAYVLENGKIVLSGKGKVLLEDPRVREAYLGL